MGKTRTSPQPQPEPDKKENELNAFQSRVPWWIRLPLSPIADFNWRRKAAARLGASRLAPYTYHDLTEVGTKDVTPGLLANYHASLTIYVNGEIEYRLESIDNPPHKETHWHSEVFEIKEPLPKGITMVKPLVSSDGRFVRVYQPRNPRPPADDPKAREHLHSVHTYEEGRWLEWLPRQKDPGFIELLTAGLRNYHYLGTALYDRLTILFFIMATGLFFLMLFGLASQ